jgi:hypothetical protein
MRPRPTYKLTSISRQQQLFYTGTSRGFFHINIIIIYTCHIIPRIFYFLSFFLSRISTFFITPVTYFNLHKHVPTRVGLSTISSLNIPYIFAPITSFSNPTFTPKPHILSKKNQTVPSRYYVMYSSPNYFIITIFPRSISRDTHSRGTPFHHPSYKPHTTPRHPQSYSNYHTKHTYRQRGKTNSNLGYCPFFFFFIAHFWGL